MTDRLKHYGEALVIFLAVFALWWSNLPKPAPVGATVIAQPAPELKGQPKQDIAPSKVAVYTPSAKAKLDLPVEIQHDPNKYALGSARLPSDTHPHTITTVIDSKTGDVQTFDQREALPWLAAERRGWVQVGYGVKTGVGKVWRAAGALDLLQVKALHVGLDGTLDTDGQGYAGGHVRYEF